MISVAAVFGLTGKEFSTVFCAYVAYELKISGLRGGGYSVYYCIFREE